MSECNIAVVATMPPGNLGDVVFEFISWFLRLYIFLKLEEGGIFADIDQSSEEDVHLASFQGGDFILFQKKQLAFFIAKVVESRSHWKEFDPECRLDQVLKSSSHNLLSSYVEAELISNLKSLYLVVLWQALIEDIVATAQRAPSSFNSQPYKVKSLQRTWMRNPP